jgi:hypothetical protein
MAPLPPISSLKNVSSYDSRSPLILSNKKKSLRLAAIGRTRCYRVSTHFTHFMQRLIQTSLRVNTFGHINIYKSMYIQKVQSQVSRKMLGISLQSHAAPPHSYTFTDASLSEAAIIPPKIPLLRQEDTLNLGRVLC